MPSRTGVASTHVPPRGARAPRGPPDPGVIVLDVVFLAAILALFALVALVARGVEKLGPQPGAPSSHPTGRGGDAA